LKIKDRVEKRLMMIGIEGLGLGLGWGWGWNAIWDLDYF
jgi:hypothetical protein